MKAFGTFALLAATLFFGTSSQAITIATVPIGNPGNAPDLRYVDTFHPNGVGAVDYWFEIGKTEVTNAQYAAFLNAVAATDTYRLYRGQRGIVQSGSPGMYTYAVKDPDVITSGPLAGTIYAYDDKPAVAIWAQSIRFVNWLHNGQPSGAQDATTTEDGAYTLNGARSTSELTGILRNPGARWWLPSEDEWYKAAYHKNDGVTGNYWDYPMGNDAPPNNNWPSADTGDSGSFNRNIFPASAFPLTDAGAYLLSASPYGTFDQGGNLIEWNDTAFLEGAGRGARGGSYFSPQPNPFDKGDLHASRWYQTPVGQEEGFPTTVGFRVATVPEPTAALQEFFALFALLFRRSCRSS
jgi:formylglycine-generating enzyme